MIHFWNEMKPVYKDWAMKHPTMVPLNRIAVVIRAEDIESVSDQLQAESRGLA